MNLMFKNLFQSHYFSSLSVYVMFKGVDSTLMLDGQKAFGVVKLEWPVASSEKTRHRHRHRSQS